MSLNQGFDNNLGKDLNKNFLNRIHYLLNKKLNQFNLNKVDSIYQNTQTLIKEFEKQNQKLNNKISVLENLMILMNKEINDLKKKLKTKNNKELIEENKNMNLIDEIIEIENKELYNKNEIKKVSSFNNYECREIKKEKLQLDIDFAKKNLHNHNINSDFQIFKSLYINNIPQTNYPIRHINGNYQYWCNEKMNTDDENGNYIKDTIIDNIMNLYLEINNYDDYKDDNDLFLKNQEYILNMAKPKYKDKFFKNILKIIDYK